VVFEFNVVFIVFLPTVIQLGSQHILEGVSLGIVILYIHRMGYQILLRHHVIAIAIHVFPIDKFLGGILGVN
jgi:hypothetical protein